MAEIAKTIVLLLCDRCLPNREVKAVSQVRFSIDGGKEVNVDLCSTHVAMIRTLGEPARTKDAKSGEPFPCPICDAPMLSGQALGQHTKNHHPEVSPRIAELKTEVRKHSRRNGEPMADAQGALSELAKLYDIARRAWQAKTPSATPGVKVSDVTDTPAPNGKPDAPGSYPLEPPEVERVHV